MSAMITNPFYVIKTRMYTSKTGDINGYKGLFDGMRKIVTNEGLFGLWKGTLLSLGTVINSALQFTLYEEMKKIRFASLQKHSKRNKNDRLVCE